MMDENLAQVQNFHEIGHREVTEDVGGMAAVKNLETQHWAVS